MLPKVVGAVAAGLALATLAVPATAGQVQKVPTTVLIESYEEETDGDDLVEGAVTSPKRKCVLGRRVTVFENSAGSGPPIRLGITFADSNEHWTLRGTIPITETGEVYAQVKKLKLRKGVVCKADRSPILELDF